MVGVSVLDRKLLRDLRRLWAQVIAIALVMACGVATIIIAVGSHRSLEETRTVFYDRYRFADLFVSASRAPDSLVAEIASLDGVAALDARIVKPVLLDMAGMAEPATGIVLSIPDSGEAAVNRLHLRAGRMPEAGREGEVAVVETFASAHRMVPGVTFSAIINGARRTLTVTAIVLSPEYVYAIGPGDMVPDQRRFGVLYMPRQALAGLTDMDGAFNSLVIRTVPGAATADLIAAVDRRLERYGGTGMHDRKTQVSHAYLDNELVQLRAMAAIIPPVFLFVSAFLVNMILSRLIALEREQIGLMKALGLSDLAIGWHYVKLTLVIAVLGAVIGAGAGIWGGRSMTALYARFFSFPFLIFRQSLDLHLIAVSTTLAAALIGSLRSIASVVRLPAAIAMQPPAPERFHRLFGNLVRSTAFASQLTVMVIRNMVRRPLRTLLTTVGTSLSVALLIAALFTFDAIDSMVDTIFFRAERADATIVFSAPRPASVVEAVERLPGVLRAEPFRGLDVILRSGHREKQVMIQSGDAGDVLSQTLDADGRRVTAPPSGLMISERLAAYLGVRIGDSLSVEIIEKGHRIAEIPVGSIYETYVGLTATMQAEALSRLAGEGAVVSGARLAIDPLRLGDFYAAVKVNPAIAGLALQNLSRDRFRATIGENIAIVTTVYVTLALIITFGVIYNSARIRLSEQGRELASLRVLGFTRGEVSAVLLIELAIIVAMAQPLGWLFGYGISALMIREFESDLFRVPFVLEERTFALASLFVAVAALVSALVVRRRIDRLDLVAVLKTRE